MNSRLDTHVAGMKGEPFLAQAARLGQGHLDASLIQGVLNRDNQAHIRTMLAQLPEGQRTAVTSQLDHFIALSKTAFSDAVSQVFLVAACLMCIAFVVVLFLPQIPLRKSAQPAAQEVGTILDDELAQSDKRHEPRVIAGGQQNRPN